MDALARREHSRSELAAKLTGAGGEPALVDSVLETLKVEGLQSDRRFCESFIASAARRGKGPVRIRHDLEQRGLEPGLIAAAFDESGTDWFELAAEVRRQKFGSQQPGDFPERARQMRFLQYRGFDADQINASFDVTDD